MKNILIILFLLLCSSCATTKNTETTTAYDYITAEVADRAIYDCDDTNGGRWWMHIGGVSVVVLQLENCLGIDKVLMMITPSEQYTQDILNYSYKLLGLHFLEHMKVASPHKIWSLEQIKEIHVPATTAPEEPAKWIVIYKINSTTVECTGNSCRRHQPTTN